MKQRHTSAMVALVVAAAMVVGVGTVAVDTASGATTTATGTVVSVGQSPYGSILTVGSGQFAGYSVYLFSRDAPGHIACQTTVVAAVNVSCTGSETDKTADWPAVETSGAPIAGAGVKRGLLGTVYRKDLHASQVTYAGHPLYLFDMGPQQFAGANFVESVLPFPPWRGIWYLVSPSTGRPATGQATVTPQTLVGGQSVVSAVMFPGVGATPFTTYVYSKDTPHHSACTGACALVWPPVLTVGRPQVAGGLSESLVGQITRADGTHQVTYHGQPLYFYSKEIPRVDAKGNPLNPATTGNGNGLRGPGESGGTFHLRPPA
jgi:predicted lipoprotein with Yx(FWY)xxD motif